MLNLAALLDGAAFGFLGGTCPHTTPTACGKWIKKERVSSQRSLTHDQQYQTQCPQKFLLSSSGQRTTEQPCVWLHSLLSAEGRRELDLHHPRAFQHHTTQKEKTKCLLDQIYKDHFLPVNFLKLFSLCFSSLKRSRSPETIKALECFNTLYQDIKYRRLHVRTFKCLVIFSVSCCVTNVIWKVKTFWERQTLLTLWTALGFP